ncbi:PQQ-binding-like beta-propeller repeat protein [Enterobacteriaceae endosymbiont of Donacia tomentosa]|uniref:outer membrane protein assembly factor BamB family protein n=1 Tax=Enterobacteriaceae endosymbiont of Donacia tomentosa TaxID=2675787 RepID=UPI001449D587|nr:PQQ-binding-like beta-propeller repeat protein [Enterobacteriaceae endosymbiont of Donacia tomentosa]QJC31498.1 PQQ-binding-like beta-propeller repeat protein [Enterobacteriaceae endosymbiont of Donacia tomentosa]
MKIQKYIILIFIFFPFFVKADVFNNWYLSNNFFFKEKKKSKIDLELLWTKKIGHGKYIFTQLEPAYKKGLLYVTDTWGSVYCIDIYTGEIIWNINLIKKFCFFHCDSKYLFSGPVISDNYLYLSSEKGIVFALNIKNGNKIWEKNVFGEILSKPIIKNNILLIYNMNDILQALNKYNGKILWTINLGITNKLNFRGSSSPVIFFNNVILGGNNGIVSSRIINNGMLVWETNLTKFNSKSDFLQINDIDIQPLIYNGIVYASSYNGSFVAIDLSNGNIIWEKIYFTHKNFIINNNIIYLIDTDNNIYTLNTKNGNIIWIQKEFKKYDINNLLFYKAKIYFTDNKGFIYWINAKTGKFIGKQRISKKNIHKLLLIKNMIVIQNIYGKIYVLTIK